MIDAYAEIMRKAMSCRTEDQLNTCRDWMYRVAPLTSLSEEEILKLDYMIDTLMDCRLKERTLTEEEKKAIERMKEALSGKPASPRRAPVFKWQQSKEAVS